jgi:hypothetical protein
MLSRAEELGYSDRDIALLYEILARGTETAAAGVNVPVPRAARSGSGPVRHPWSFLSFEIQDDAEAVGANLVQFRVALDAGALTVPDPGCRPRSDSAVERRVVHLFGAVQHHQRGDGPPVRR